ncbi:threonine synthase [Hydrogenoanaerobacterium saccharovorans]|uniref:Threonine synthase n=1 Tax=Hydrogenoanaerobacterium saccharovorans TaxID=474960 RepID=A0A1H7Z8H2_9FIRM|nr:threonine synthase [Hydrogenoanaerobacterium saccharovorans]RPF48807.1 threonine synthase [Hydrogenoanaerobacterium saccharovorans]SEM53779.1 threonine synthase [Hydrogenoanaerobacterium saccharovorans]
MNYISTRDKTQKVPSAVAIANGISKEGGLFVPESFPQITEERLLKLSKMSYTERAKNILGDFLTDFTDDELYHCVTGAYTDKFEDDSVTRIAKLGDDIYMLELWHGPTCAFKDMALQLLPYLLKTSAEKTVDGKEIVILVATSGDTGKAALEGFKDVEGTRIMVFYPEQGVSPMQKLQMATQEGENVTVCAIKGNFDDAQTAVKQIFTDKALAERLAANNMMFSSANSINWGRLVPQIVYYISAYCDLLADEEIAIGDKINVCVPTGNFGNILAAYYAKKMGLPIAKFICASNENNVLTDFIRTGTYNKKREFHATISPSMDILISSNLERLLFSLYEGNDVAVKKLMSNLNERGSYAVSDVVREHLQAEFYGGYCDDVSTKATIKNTFKNYSYLCDTHTAVAMNVYNGYVKETGDKTKTVIASTASPFKFAQSVLESVAGTTDGFTEFEMTDKLAELTGCAVPDSLALLKDKAPRFADVCNKAKIEEYVVSQLNLK